jgi:hypothetical protein
MPRTPADRRAYAQGADMGFNYITDHAASLFLHPLSYNFKFLFLPWLALALAGPYLAYLLPRPSLV